MKHEKNYLHKRERYHDKSNDLEKFPSDNKWIKYLDNITFFVAIIMPLTAFPQVYNIWVLEKAGGVSLLTWSLFLILGIPMLAYGIIHKEKPIIVLNALWIIMYVLIISGLVIYS